VFDPCRNELFTAEKGSGAFLNGRRIHVSRVAKLAQSLTCTGFPNDRRTANPNILFYHQMAMETHGVRRGGSAAIDLAYVASGRLDAFWEFGLKPWDLAAGKLLVTEAGGRFTEMRGGAHSMKSGDILADNGLLHEELLARFGEIFRGELRHPIPVLG